MKVFEKGMGYVGIRELWVIDSKPTWWLKDPVGYGKVWVTTAMGS